MIRQFLVKRNVSSPTVVALSPRKVTVAVALMLENILTYAEVLEHKRTTLAGFPSAALGIAIDAVVALVVTVVPCSEILIAIIVPYFLPPSSFSCTAI